MLKGLKPDGIKLIQNDTIKDFIYLCLSNRDVRPSALELMQHKLFSDDSLDDLLFHLSSGKNLFTYSDVDINFIFLSGKNKNLILKSE